MIVFQRDKNNIDVENYCVIRLCKVCVGCLSDETKPCPTKTKQNALSAQSNNSSSCLVLNRSSCVEPNFILGLESFPRESFAVINPQI